MFQPDSLRPPFVPARSRDVLVKAPIQRRLLLPQMPFADVAATVAHRLQDSGKNIELVRQLALSHLAGIAVVGHPVIVRIKSGQQRSPRWRAERGDGESVGKIHPLRCQMVEGGRLAYRIAVGAERVEALLVAAE